MSDTTRDRLARIAQRVEAATTAPWRRVTTEFRGSLGHSVKSAPSGMVVAFGGYGPEGGGSWSDAEFIAHARTDIPAMHAALTAVLALCDRFTESNSVGESWGDVPMPMIHRAINDALGGE